MNEAQPIHATAVAFQEGAVLLLGESGSGKSDLALRLLDGGCVLVADDQVQLNVHEGRLHARAPQSLQGHIEVRGVGIVNLPFLPEAEVMLAVQLVPRGEVERMPADSTYEHAGVVIPLLRLHAFDDSTAAKIRLVCAALARPPAS